MITRILFTLLGSLSFLYLFWRKLREDYTPNQIFNVSFYILFGIFAFSILSARFVPEWTFWLSFSGSLFGLFIGISRFRLRIFELIEAWVLGGLGLTMVFYVFLWVKTFSLESFAPVVILFLFLFFYLFLDAHYKKFTWYKSGRIGFAGLGTLGVFFLLRSLVALLEPGMLFFVGKSDAIISGLVAFLSFLILFNISRKEG